MCQCPQYRLEEDQQEKVETRRMSSEARRGEGVDEGFFISVRDYLIVVFRSFLFIFSVFILCRGVSPSNTVPSITAFLQPFR